MNDASPSSQPNHSARALTWIVVSMCAVYFFAFFQRVAVPGTIFNELQAEFHTGAGTIAWLAALYLYIYGSLQLVVGLLNDRFGAARVLLAGGLLLSLGSLLFPLAPSLPLLFTARALVGLGASLIFVSIVKALDGLFAPRHFAQILGVCLFLGYTGGLTGTLPFEMATAAAGWRRSLLGAGILCSLAVVAMLLLFRRVGLLDRPHHATSPRVLMTILRNPHTWPVLVTGSTSFAVYFLIQATIGKKFLSDYCGLSSAQAAGFTFLMMSVTMTIMLAGGFLSSLHGNRRKPLMAMASGCCLAACLCLLLCLRLKLSGGWFLGCYVLLGLCCLNSPLGNALMKELNPPEAVGTSIGLLNGTCYLVVALVSNMAGWIMDRYQAQTIKTADAVIYPMAAYQAIFVVCAVLAFLSLIAALCLKESYGQPIESTAFPETSID